MGELIVKIFSTFVLIAVIIVISIFFMRLMNNLKSVHRNNMIEVNRKKETDANEKREKMRVYRR